MRDNFSKGVKQIIADRVGHRCSNPSCRIGTKKADPFDECKSINLGIAAHIKAASPKGPRYDAGMSKEERKNVKNGIWLCGKCAKEIDDTPEAYPLDLLYSWRKQAEMITAREAAATTDGIGEIISLIEETINKIHDYIDWQFSNEPSMSRNHDDDFAIYGAKIIDYGRSQQQTYDKEISPFVSEILMKCEGILGPNNESLNDAMEGSSYAHTNLLCAKDMANKLDELRISLLLR